MVIETDTIKKTVITWASTNFGLGLGLVVVLVDETFFLAPRNWFSWSVLSSLEEGLELENG